MPRFDKQAIATYLAQQLQDGKLPTAESTAEQFHMSYFYFSRSFKQQFGVTFKEYLSAHKINQGIGIILSGQSVTDAQLEAGFESLGTFSTTFKQHTGLSPKIYALNTYKLARSFANLLQNPPKQVNYHDFDVSQHPQEHTLTITIPNALPHRVNRLPAITFIGLYPKAMPRGFPVVGVALSEGNTCEINAVPNGSYYVLACQVVLTPSLMRYFDLTDCLRVIYPGPISFPLTTDTQVELILREELPTDPPITVNLPKLLFEGIYQHSISNKS